MSVVEHYYDIKAAEEWERLEEHRTEFAVTMRALNEYLPAPPASILDVGGGPGRYAIALAQQGYHVTLVDLSSGCLRFARAKAQEAVATLAGYIHANALDLGAIPGGSYDSVLLLGPMYHLQAAEERRQAVAEAARVLVPGGRIFAAFITRYAPIRFVAK
jgi:ubiquinone/menaquinone biosynthesis C-methylase UbiE